VASPPPPWRRSFRWRRPPDALAAVRAWTAALFPSLDRQDAHIAAGHLAALELPVRLVFGAADRYLNPDLAGQLVGLFQRADLHLVQCR
jgi:haloalkane dehalogenase